MRTLINMRVIIIIHVVHHDVHYLGDQCTYVARCPIRERAGDVLMQLLQSEDVEQTQHSSKA
jgi:hypothetical protein